jgi:hypothetical protein
MPNTPAVNYLLCFLGGGQVIIPGDHNWAALWTEGDRTGIEIVKKDGRIVAAWSWDSVIAVFTVPVQKGGPLVIPGHGMAAN